MQVRSFNKDTDYNDVSAWWEKQGWPVLPAEVLSSAGFIVEHEGQRLAATWIFATNCPIYIMEWTVANPDVSWEQRQDAIKLVTDSACDWAKQDGAVQVFTMTKSKRFIDKLQEYGFQKTEDGMTHLVRSL
jgi:hypothetical protein